MLPIIGMMNSLPRRRGRPPGMSSARLRKCHIIAAGVVAGVKLAASARQSQVSRSWASREAHSPETRQLLQKLASDPELIESLLHKSTNGILSALRAEKQYRRAGQIIIRGPDHRIRLQAAKATLHLVERHARFGLRLEQMDPLVDDAWQRITDALEAEKVVCRSAHLLIRRPDHGVRRKAAELATAFVEKIDWKAWRAPEGRG